MTSRLLPQHHATGQQAQPKAEPDREPFERAAATAPPPTSAEPPRVPRGPSFVAMRERLDLAGLHSFATSSPGRLIGIGVLLIGLCLAAGALSATTASERQQGLDVLLNDTEPDAHSAHHLYTTLSIADAAAGTAFIAGGLEPEAVRDRYSQAVGEAAAELVAQTGNSTRRGSDPASDPDTQLRTGIATGLPVYTGLIETARANNRSGYPIGAAYLSEASNQMQTVLLPMAEELQDHRSAAVSATQRDHLRPPWSAIGLLILALTALIWAQIELAKRWRRVLNPGLLLASCAMLILLAWTVIAGSVSATAMIRGRDDGAVPASRLTESRTLTQQARSAEMLKLVRRDTTSDYDRTYDAGISRLTDLLDGYPADAPAANDIASARAALDRWRVAHQRMTERLDRGDFVAATKVATGYGATDSAAQVDTLDAALDRGIVSTRNALRGNTSQATRVLDFLTPGALALGILAAGYVGLGIWPRLREYQ